MFLSPVIAISSRFYNIKLHHFNLFIIIAFPTNIAKLKSTKFANDLPKTHMIHQK